MEYLDTIKRERDSLLLMIRSQYLKYIIYGALLLVSLVVTLIVNKIFEEKRIYNLSKNISKNVKNSLKNNTSDNKTSYEKIDEKLSRLGNKFRSKGRMTPEKYFLYKIVLTIIFGALGTVVKINGVPMFLEIIGFACVGYIMLDLLSEMRNKKDNSDMSDDLKAMCDTFYIQSKVGRSIENILLEIYLQTKNQRLKKAVMELNIDLLDRTSVEEKIDNFNKKFKNEIIDRICIILKQAEKSGYSTEFFKVVSEEIKNISTIEQMAEKEKLNTTVMLLEVGIFIAIFVALLFMVLHDTNSGIAMW